MKKLTKKNLLEHLNKSDKEDLITEVVTLFEKFDNVKEFYRGELSADNNPVLDTYKKKITQAYLKVNPKERSTNLNVNKLIAAFKKVNLYKDELIDLNLHRVECGVAAFARDKNRTETFYNCILKSFEEAVNIIVSQNLVAEYETRLESIIKNTGEGKYEIRSKLQSIFEKIQY